MVNARQRGTSAAYLMNPQRNAPTLYWGGGTLRSAPRRHGLAGIALHFLQVWSGAERGSAAAALCFCEDGGQDEPDGAELGSSDVTRLNGFSRFGVLCSFYHEQTSALAPCLRPPSVKPGAPAGLEGDNGRRLHFVLKLYDITEGQIRRRIKVEELHRETEAVSLFYIHM